MSNQLIKNTALGTLRVYPKTYTEGITDKSTGKKLAEILSNFNMYFLSYTGNTAQTRCQVPKDLRREGLWITYVDFNHKVITEWYNSDNIDNETWGVDTYWRQGSNKLIGDISISVNGNWVINGKETEFKATGDPIKPLLRVNFSTNKLQVSYDDGNKYENLGDNPVYTQFRTLDNKLLVSTDLGKTWTDTSEYIAAWFRWTDADSNGNLGKILISRDNTTWQDMTPNFVNNLYIKGYVATVGLLPTNTAALGDIYMVGPTYDESDTTHDYPHYRMWVKLASGWVDNGEYLSNVLISLTTGLETGITMSLKAITDSIAKQGIYDVSANNDGAVFESLSALLNNANLNTLIPTSVRYGGMSIRFIQGYVPNSDNKYVQFRYIGTDVTTSATFTNVANWQGIDDEPTVGSHNLVESDGIYGSIEKETSIYKIMSGSVIGSNRYYMADGRWSSDITGIYAAVYDLSQYVGKRVNIKITNTALSASAYYLPWVFDNDGESGGTVVLGHGETAVLANIAHTIDISVEIPSTDYYLKVCSTNSTLSNVVITVIQNGIKILENQVQENTSDINELQEDVNVIKPLVSPSINFDFKITNKDRCVYTGNQIISVSNGACIAILDVSRAKSIHLIINNPALPAGTKYYDYVFYSTETPQNGNVVSVGNAVENVSSSYSLDDTVNVPSGAKIIAVSLVYSGNVGTIVPQSVCYAQLYENFQKEIYYNREKIAENNADLENVNLKISEIKKLDIRSQSNTAWFISNNTQFSEELLLRYANSLKINSYFLNPLFSIKDTEQGLTDTLVHDCTIDIKENDLYSILTANNTDIPADNPKSTATTARMDIVRDYANEGRTIETYTPARKNDVIDGFTIATGTGVPNLKIVDNTVNCMYTASDVASQESVGYTGKWTWFCSKFNITSKTWNSHNKCKFIYDGNEYDFDLPNIYDVIAAPNGIMRNRYTNQYFNNNSTIAEYNGEYYIACCVAEHLISPIIFKTTDFITWTFVTFLPIDCNFQYEAALCAKDGFLYMCTRGMEVNVLSKYNISNGSWVDYQYLSSNADSRPCFFKDVTNNVWLWYTPQYGREKGIMIQINTTRLNISKAHCDVTNGSQYPCVVRVSNGFIASHTRNGKIDICHFALPYIQQGDINNVFVGLFSKLL